MREGQRTAETRGPGQTADYKDRRRRASSPGPLERLEAARRLRPGANEAEAALGNALTLRVDDPETLVRLHDAALSLRAYPHSPGVRDRAERLLAGTAGRVAALAEAGCDLSPLDGYEAAGIAGVPIAMPFSFDVARQIAARRPGSLRVDWDAVDQPDRLGSALPRFLPFLPEEALVDANVAFREWVDAARGGVPDAAWLLSAFDGLPRSPAEKAELWDALGLQLAWEPDARETRTGMRLPPRCDAFFHDGPLLARRDVSLSGELAGPPLPTERVSRRDGTAFLAAAQAAMAVRYRELYAFTHGDPGSVVRADAGRGLELWVCGIAADRRLPLRAGYGTFFVKNGVPVGYGDAFALADRVDVSLNVFYAFRDGESAYLYARLLRLLEQLLGARTFAVDPYQVGHENEEAIASGAFWFYRKLGFRSADPALERLVRREEARLAARPGTRTSPATLRRLAAGGVVHDVEGATRGAWDGFHIRRLGLAIQRHAAASKPSPGGGAKESTRRVARALGLGTRPSPSEAAALEGLAPLLDLLGVASWSSAQRAGLAAIVRAKGGPTEERYVRLLARHRRLVEALRAAGRAGTAP